MRLRSSIQSLTGCHGNFTLRDLPATTPPGHDERRPPPVNPGSGVDTHAHTRPCARAWVQVKYHYGLSVDTAEKNALTSVLSNC